MRSTNLNGRHNFHEVIMSRSYRTRGNLHRAQTNKNPVMRVSLAVPGDTPPRKNTAVMKPNRRSMPYSAMKIKANLPPPYSILNPDTISDSPSERSKGVRFASAKHNRIQVRNKGGQNIAPQRPCCVDDTPWSLNVLFTKNHTSRKRRKHTS